MTENWEITGGVGEISAVFSRKGLSLLWQSKGSRTKCKYSLAVGSSELHKRYRWWDDTRKLSQVRTTYYSWSYVNQSLFYRYPQNMSTAKTFQFALTLLTVTLRGKYIRLLLRVYKEGVCFCGINGIQLYLFSKTLITWRSYQTQGK